MTRPADALFRRAAVEHAAAPAHGRATRATAGGADARRLRRRLPVVLQGEMAECGLACLAMVAGCWGRRVELPALRERFGVSLRGSTLRSLIDAAQALGFVARPVKLDLPLLRELPLPCVLHWEMNHFVVLAEVSRTHVVVHDPAGGRLRLTMAQVSQRFTGVALELRPGPGFEAVDARRPFALRGLLGPMAALRRGLAQGLVLALALQAAALAAPFYLQWVVDRALPRADRGEIALLSLAFLALAGTRAALAALRSWTTAVLAMRVNYQWLSNAFTHLMGLPLAYFERRHATDIAARFNSIQVIQRQVTTQAVEAVVDGLLALAALGIMAHYSVALSAIVCASMGAYAALRAFAFRALREATADQIALAARQQAHFLESTRGVVSLRLFERTRERGVAWMNRLAEQLDAELRIARRDVAFRAAHLALTGIENVVVVWLLALAVIDARLTIGAMFAFVAYKEHFGASVGVLIDRGFEFRMLRLHAERVADILQTPLEREPENAVALGEGAPAIELRGLSFRYAEGEAWVLKDLDLAIPAGQCVAITGASGCGKTTLVKLLLGLLEPTAGEILVDGVPLARVGGARWRRRVAAVMQDEPLFAGTIADNIAFFDPQPSQERLEACAAQAAVADEIGAMPMGWRTLVGEGGGGLSGGQKQRILLARALYKQPALLVLDEATSHLDVRAEAAVNAAIGAGARTRLVVAHRPQTIAMAERIVVLAGGRVASDTSRRTEEIA